MVIPEDIEKEALALEAQAQELRRRAEWGDDYPWRKIASGLIDQWCRDPEMWGTHGIPGELKLQRLERDIAAALKAQPHPAN